MKHRATDSVTLTPSPILRFTGGFSSDIVDSFVLYLFKNKNRLRHRV